MGEARAHQPVASTNCLARGVGHGAVKAVAIEVRAGRFGWPAIKKAGGKKTAREIISQGVLETVQCCEFMNLIRKYLLTNICVS